MKLLDIFESEFLIEKRYAVNRNPTNGTWQLRIPAPGMKFVDEATRVVLQDARPFIDWDAIDKAEEAGKQPGVVAFIEGEKIADYQPTTQGRAVGYMRGKMPNPFVFMDTKEEFKGSEYAIFDGSSFTAY